MSNTRGSAFNGAPLHIQLQHRDNDTISVGKVIGGRGWYVGEKSEDFIKLSRVDNKLIGVTLRFIQQHLAEDKLKSGQGL